jgi:hypothetical protein
MADDTDSIFRARMRALAYRGGAATKRRMADYPKYYRSIGRLGGLASAASRRYRAAVEADDDKPSESPIIKPPTVDVDTPAIAASHTTEMGDAHVATPELSEMSVVEMLDAIIARAS